MKIQVSHGADPGGWFVVLPLPGWLPAGERVTTEDMLSGTWQGHEPGREASAALRIQVSHGADPGRKLEVTWTS